MLMHNTALNILALNQSVFKKSLNIGQEFSPPKLDYAITNENGWHIFVNGITTMPIMAEVKELFQIGLLYHKALMVGMPNCGGHLRYTFGYNDSEFILYIGIKLDEDVAGPNDFYDEPAAFMYANRIPMHRYGAEDITYQMIAKEMLMCHLEILIGREAPDEVLNLIEIISGDLFFQNAFQEYLDRAKEEPQVNFEASLEVKEMINEMNRYSNDCMVNIELSPEENIVCPFCKKTVFKQDSDSEFTTCAHTIFIATDYGFEFVREDISYFIDLTISEGLDEYTSKLPFEGIRIASYSEPPAFSGSYWGFMN